MIRNTLRAAACLLCLATAARAEQFSTTSLLYEYAGNLRDRYYGNNAVDGAVTTVTLEHFGVWDYGDNFFFVDMLSGKMADFTGADAGTRSRLYLEWGPRLSLSKISGADLHTGPFKDVFIAAQVNRGGEGFTADMYGVGTDLDLPGFRFFSLNAYARKDNYNAGTYQVSASWGYPFTLGLPMVCEGYIDIAGTDNDGTDINTQPRLFAELARGNTGALYAGVEWFYHKNSHMEMNVPQWTVKWTW